ncbi:hypothetical protein BFAG_04558 [Bacteroides fragilis 3_1_12]|nr:hypothetical protein BFAG_04558 [Bacteroides fragilis 3_1_12]
MNINHINTMARPIKETPVITGKDTKRFAEKMVNLKPESKEEKESAKKVYEKFKAIASFTL